MNAIIELANIRADSAAQPRERFYTDVTAGYAEDMARGAEFPPLTVFFDGAVYWLADGFHRHYAALGCGLVDFPCDVRDGGLREAILHSCGANAAHGHRRTEKDKRRAVTRMLEDDEWRGWSDREIARRCLVDGKTVAKIRDELEPVTADFRSEPRSRTYTTKHGSTATMNTAAIGAKPATDLPVFGRSISGERIAAERPPKWSPENITGPARERLDTDNANGWISTLLWDVEETVSKLPAPGVAVRDFPSHHRHTMTADQARKIAAWFSDFADAWAGLHEEATHVAAE